MGFWSRQEETFEKIDPIIAKESSNSDDGGGAMGWNEGWGYPTSAGVPINQYTAMQSVAIMACVSYRSEDVAKLRPQVYQRLKNGGKILAKKHELYQLLWRPNAWQTNFEFVEMMQAAYLLRGNAYAVKLRNGRGRVIALVPINPDRVTLFESPGGLIFYFISRSGLHELAVLKDVPYMVPSDDILHLRWLSQSNSLLALSRITLMKEPIALAISQEQLAARMAGSGARLGGTLETDQRLTEDAAKRMGAEWQQTYGGLRNAGKTAVLEQGLKFKQTSMTSQDAEFLAQRQFQLEEAARSYRMPPHKLGIMGKGTASSMVQMDQDYLNNVILPDLERWEQRLQVDWDIDGDEYFVEFDVSRYLRADIKTRFEAYRAGIIGSFLKPNEARRGESLPEDPAGNNLLQPTNVAALGFTPAATGNSPSSSGPGSDVTDAPAPGGDGDTGADPSAPTV